MSKKNDWLSLQRHQLPTQPSSAAPRAPGGARWNAQRSAAEPEPSPLIDWLSHDETVHPQNETLEVKPDHDKHDHDIALGARDENVRPLVDPPPPPPFIDRVWWQQRDELVHEALQEQAFVREMKRQLVEMNEQLIRTYGCLRDAEELRAIQANLGMFVQDFNKLAEESVTAKTEAATLQQQVRSLEALLSFNQTEQQSLQNELRHEKAARRATLHKFLLLKNYGFDAETNGFTDQSVIGVDPQPDQEQEHSESLRAQLRSLRVVESHNIHEIHELEMMLNHETQRSAELEKERDVANQQIRALQRQLHEQTNGRI